MNALLRRMQFILWVALAAVMAIIVAIASNTELAHELGLDQQEVAQLGYFIVILIFVGAALLGRGIGAGEAARSTAGWLAIFLLLVGAYSYRTELTGVGSRLLGALAPGVPISGRLAGEAADAVVINRGMDGHFGIRALVQGKRMTMMVDTGASFVTLTPEDAESLGIDLGKLRFGMTISTANGEIQAAPIVVKSIEVGSITRNNVPGLVAPRHTLNQSLLGMSFLNTLDGYAISGDRMVLTP